VSNRPRAAASPFLVNPTPDFHFILNVALRMWKTLASVPNELLVTSTDVLQFVAGDDPG
jgi:hypothetical protein